MKNPTPVNNQYYWVTYTGMARYNAYGDSRPAKVRRLGIFADSDGYYNAQDEFISTPDGYFTFPQYFQLWDGVLLPHTFYSLGRVLPTKADSWEVADTTGMTSYENK